MHSKLLSSIAQISWFCKKKIGADVNVKATDGKYKDKSPLELAEDNKEINTFITDFINEANSEAALSGKYRLYNYSLAN